MTQFVGFHIDDYGEKSVPVATGYTKQEALDLTITRVLSLGITWGSMGAQSQDDLSQKDFATLKECLDKYFVGKGIQ